MPEDSKHINQGNLMRYIGSRYRFAEHSPVRPPHKGCVEVQSEIPFTITALPQVPKPVVRKIKKARTVCDLVAQLCGWNLSSSV